MFFSLGKSSRISTVFMNFKTLIKLPEVKSKRYAINYTMVTWPKGLVNPKMKIWCFDVCLSAYPQGIQDVVDFVSSVEHKQRFLTQTVASISHIMAVNGNQTFESKKKTCTDKFKLNHAAGDDQCWGKLLWKVMHYNIALLPKKVTNYVT